MNNIEIKYLTEKLQDVMANIEKAYKKAEEFLDTGSSNILKGITRSIEWTLNKLLEDIKNVNNIEQ